MEGEREGKREVGEQEWKWEKDRGGNNGEKKSSHFIYNVPFFSPFSFSPLSFLFLFSILPYQRWLSH